MDSGTFKQIEIILQEYPKYEDYIKKREEELLNPYTPQDTNIGGGKSNRTSDTTAVKAITLADDRILQRIKFQYWAVKNTYNQADDITQEIIREYYFKQPRTKTWDGIALQVHWSRRKCLNIRNAFFDRLADELGFVKKMH